MKRGCLVVTGVFGALVLLLSIAIGRFAADVAVQALEGVGAERPVVDSGLPGTLFGGSARLSIDGAESGSILLGASELTISGLSIGAVGDLTATPPRLPNLSITARLTELTIPVTTAGRTMRFASVQIEGPLERVAFTATLGADGADEAFAAFLPGVSVDPARLQIRGTAVVVTSGPQTGVELLFAATPAGFRTTTPATTSELLLPDGVAIIDPLVTAVDGSIVFSGFLDLRSLARTYGLVE